MNAGIDVPTIQRFGALYIASARLKSMSKWRTIIAAVDIGNPLFYLIAVGIGIGVLVEQGSGTSGTNGIKYIAFIAPALLANTAITGIMDETVFPTDRNWCLSRRALPRDIFSGCLLHSFARL